LIYFDLFDILFLIFSLRNEINLMNTQKEKQNSNRHIVRSAMRRRTLMASQNVLFIDEVNKMLYPFDDFPFKVKPPVMFEPSEKEIA